MFCTDDLFFSLLGSTCRATLCLLGRAWCCCCCCCVCFFFCVCFFALFLSSSQRGIFVVSLSIRRRLTTCSRRRRWRATALTSGLLSRRHVSCAASLIDGIVNECRRRHIVGRDVRGWRGNCGRRRAQVERQDRVGGGRRRERRNRIDSSIINGHWWWRRHNSDFRNHRRSRSSSSSLDRRC